VLLALPRTAKQSLVPPPQIFKSLLAASGLSRGYRPGIAVCRGAEGFRETHINNISSGIVVAPSARCQELAQLWRKWARWLVGHSEMLEAWTFHVNQVSFALTMEEMNDDVEFLPPQVNTILHILPEIATVRAFHLTTGHIPQFPQRFNADKTLNADGVAPGVVDAIMRLNDCIREALATMVWLPSTKDHLDKFLISAMATLKGGSGRLQAGVTMGLNMSSSNGESPELSQGELSAMAPNGWEQPVVAPFLLQAPTVSPKSVAIIGSYLGGLDMPGKVSRELFFPIFDYVLAPLNARVTPYESIDDFLRADTSDFARVAILVYREEADDLDAVQDGQRRIIEKHPGTLIVHPVELGRILGSKVGTNRFLSKHGFPVPRIIDQAVSDEVAFSNHAHSTQQKVHLVRPGEALDPARYNTNFIDTTHRFDGTDYFVYIRAYAVGEVRVATYVGCRPTAEDNPSVHLSDADNVAAINYFNYYFSILYEAQVQRLCATMGAVFGLILHSRLLALPQNPTPVRDGVRIQARTWACR
jgi:hypothetical protein